MDSTMKMNQIGIAQEKKLNGLTKKDIKRALRSLLSLLWLAMVAGCATDVTLAPQSSAPSAVPASTIAADHPRTANSEQQVWQINRRQSLIAITVHRGGALARLGHDHVVASRDIQGQALQDPATGHPAAGSADLHFRLDQLTVDEPALRKEAGFDTRPGPDAVAGTRVNMLTRVLEAERFPLVSIHASWPAGAAQNAGMTGTETATETEVRLAITLHGVTRTIAATARITRDGDVISVEGSLSLNQSDFGIVPFSVMAGALAVKDGLDLRFHIVFDKAPG